MKGERHVGGEIRVLSNLIKRCMDDGMPPETTGMQGWIIGFLHRNEDRDMFQRDVEAEFNIRRSTATGILQLMEKNGFLLREPVAYDARLKKLVLTPKALAVHEGVISRIRATEASPKTSRPKSWSNFSPSQPNSAAIWSECPLCLFHAAGAGAAFSVPAASGFPRRI